MSIRVNKLYEFDEFRLDAATRSLWRKEQLVPLSPKALELLFMLVEREGKIISKQEIFDKVWAGIFVEDGVLTQNIYTLRRLLGQKLIENVPRRGYRIAVPVTIVEENSSQRLIENQNGAGETAVAPDNIENERIPVARRRQKPYLWFGAATLLILFVGFIAFQYIPVRVLRSSEASFQKVSFQKLTFTGDISSPVISPDGKSFAYVKGDKLVFQEINSEKAAQLNIPGVKSFGFLQFSPDGNSLYFRNPQSSELAGSVFRVSRFGGTPQIVFENVWSGFDFSHDGKRVVFVRFHPNQSEYVVIAKDLESGEEKILLMQQSPGSLYLEDSPVWSADDRRIAAVVRNPQASAGQIVIINVADGKTETIETPRLFQIEQLAWLPDGNNLIASAREKQKFFQLWRVSIPGGEVQRITNDLNIYRGASLSADGKSLLVRQYTTFSHLWNASADNLTNLKQLTFGNQNRDGAYGMTWTPGGNIVYVSRIMGNWDLWDLHPNDGSRRRLTENFGDYNLYPAITSDGKKIFFHSNKSGASHIWQMDASGENPAQITFSDTETERFAAVSPDSEWLYYIQRSPKFSAVWRKSLVNAGSVERLSAQTKISPSNFLSLSPNGNYLAFQNMTETAQSNSENQAIQIGVINVAEHSSSEPRFFNIAASCPAIQWTRDSTAIDYIENTAHGANLWRQNLEQQTPPQLILNLPKDYLFNFAWSVDGKNLGLARGQELNDAMLLTEFYP